MSFREKHLAISIFATVLVWSVYFYALIRRVMDGDMADPRFAFIMGVAFAGAVFVVAVVEASLTLFATLTTPKAEREARDEREMLAAYKASHISLMALVALVICLGGVAWFAALGSPTFGTDARVNGAGLLVLLANQLVACVVVSELMRFGLTLYFLRRGR